MICGLTVKVCNMGLSCSSILHRSLNAGCSEAANSSYQTKYSMLRCTIVAQQMHDHTLNQFDHHMTHGLHKTTKVYHTQ